jgi:hypothetical protein
MEDIEHFAVRCPKKWEVWRISLQRVAINSELIPPGNIWAILSLHRAERADGIEWTKFGRVFAGIWKYVFHELEPKLRN